MISITPDANGNGFTLESTEPIRLRVGATAEGDVLAWLSQDEQQLYHYEGSRWNECPDKWKPKPFLRLQEDK